MVHHHFLVCSPECCTAEHADLAIVVEVGVEADSAMARGLEVDQHGGLGVVLGEEHVKLEAAIGIGRVRGSSDQHLIQITKKEYSTARLFKL